MAKRRWLVGCPVVVLLGVAVLGCGKEDGEERTARTQSALSTSLFQPYVSYPTGSWAEAVAIGDLDGDGRNDVALVTSYYYDAANDYTVHVFLQASDGSLKPRVKYPVGARSSSLEIGDVNGDGRADVVVGLGSPNGMLAGTQIGVLLQNAAGTLDPLVSYPTVNSYRVKVGDFNGDGRVDVAGINNGVAGDGLDVLLQTETGVLAPPVTYHVPHFGLDELDAGDIDGDGRTDLIVMTGQNGQAPLPTVSVLLQTADGGLGAPTSYMLGGTLLARGVGVGDTDGDGRSDIVVSYGGNRPSGFIARFPQNAQGAMDPAVSYASYDIPSALVVADADGDGRKDVLVTHDGWNRLGVYRQYPSGDFNGEELYAISSASHYQPQGLAFGDINGDGLPDAVIADTFNGLIVLRHVNDVSLALAVTSPAAGSSTYTGFPVTVRWAAGDTVPITSFDVSVSFNNGSSYTPIPGCTGLPATARECLWPSAGPAGYGVRVRVTATDDAAHTASAETTFTLNAPSITVTGPFSPLFVGTATTISWFHNLPAGGTVRIELSRDGGSTFETLADAAPNTGAFSWNVTGPNTSSARVRISSDGSPPASGSSSNFTIATPTLTVTAPTAGTTAFTPSLSVAWTHNVGNGSTVRIELSRDGGATFETLAATATNTGTFKTAIAGPGAADARVRVTTNGPITATGTSASFALVVPTVTVTAPADGATAFVGGLLSIAWSTNLPTSFPAFIELSRDGGSSFQFLQSVPNTGSSIWVVTGPVTAAARVRVSFGQSQTLLANATSGAFAIVTPSLTVTGPAAPVYTGTPTAITWVHNLPPTDTVRVELSRDGATFTTLAAAAPNTGSFTWSVTGPDSLARVRVTSNSTGATGTSPPFAIMTTALTVTAPAAGAVLVGPELPVSWTMSNLMSTTAVRIELSRDGGATFQTIAATAPTGPTGGSFVFATGPITNAQVRVTTVGPVIASGTSGTFAMAQATLAVTSPAPGATVYAGTTVAVGWSTNLPSTSSVRVELTRNGSTFETLAAAAPNTGSFTWNVTGPDSLQARVRVTSTGTSGATGTSSPFSILTPALTVTAPAAGAVLFGPELPISWTSNLASATAVQIELSLDGGATFQTIASAAPTGPAGGSFLAATAPSPNARVRITAVGPVTVSSTSGSFAMLSPTLTVTSPAPGASVYAGTTVAVGWSTNLPDTATVRVDLTRDGGSTFETLAAAAPNSGSFTWTATGPDAAAASVRVTVVDYSAASGASGPFAMVTPSLTVTAPATGALAYAGTPVTIAWTDNLSASDPVSIELSRDGGATFETLAAAAPNTGSFVWTASGPDSALARVRVTSTGALSASGIGAAFQIATLAVTVTAPAVGANWAIGIARTISWSSNLPAGITTRVELSRDGGATWTALATAAPATGSLGWNVIGPATTAARVRVSANGFPALGASGAFAIGAPALALSSPAAAAQWTIGTPRAITWSTNLLPTATVKIELSRNGGSTYTTLATAAPNTGSFAWTPTGSATTVAILRLTAGGVTTTGPSQPFALVAGSVTVTSPNSAVTWTTGSVHAITWTHNAGPGAQFMIEVSRNGVWSVITAATPGDATSGSYNWKVTGPTTTNAKIRVTWTGNTAAKDTSDVAFKIN